MQFEPKTKEQLDQENLLASGRYPFTIKESAEAADKNKKPFFKLKVFVHAPDGRDWHVFDNVSNYWMAGKFFNLCEVVGLGDKYKSGNIDAADLIDRQGFCDVEQEAAKGGYRAKNIITDYVPENQPDGSAGSFAPATATKATDPAADDDVPF